MIHVNGPPGIGKTTLGRLYVDAHPLSLLLDIDGIRTTLGAWEAADESKLVARRLALAMAETHLRGGHDVVVPQLVARAEFADELAGVAKRSGVHFVELLLQAPAEVAVDRFHRRRSELRAKGEDHPEADLSDEAVEAAIVNALATLTSVARKRSDILSVSAHRGIDETYAHLAAAIDSRRR
jgi:predicted kinase